MVTKQQLGESVGMLIWMYEVAMAKSEMNRCPSADELQWRTDTRAVLAELRKVSLCPR